MRFFKWNILSDRELDEQYKIISDRAITLGYNRAMIKAHDLYAVDELPEPVTPIPREILDAFREGGSGDYSTVA